MQGVVVENHGKIEVNKSEVTQVTLHEKKVGLAASLSGITDPQKRLAWLLEHYKNVSGLPAEFKTDANRVPGCLSKLWLVKTFTAGLCHFASDSDSKIVRAMASLICEFYSGQPPGEILNYSPSFLRDLGLSQLLTQNRQNGLSRLWEEIRTFASLHHSTSQPASPEAVLPLQR